MFGIKSGLSLTGTWTKETLSPQGAAHQFPGEMRPHTQSESKLPTSPALHHVLPCPPSHHSKQSKHSELATQIGKWDFQTLRWAACMHDQSLSRVWLFVTPWTVPCQAPLFMSLRKYWSGLPFPPPGDLPDPRIKTTSPATPTLADRFFTTESPGKAQEEQTNHQLFAEIY